MYYSASSRHSISSCTYPYSRKRLEKHYVQLDDTLLYGYEGLSDGARLTYAVLLSFDYVDEGSGAHKGYVFPSIETLMHLRSKGRSTMYSHLAELEQCGLIESIAGGGWRLYNPSDDEERGEEDRNLPCYSSPVLSNSTAPEDPVLDPCQEIPTNNFQDRSTHIFQKSGRLLMDEEDISRNKQIQYSEAEQAVVDKLIRLGFDTSLACQFVERYDQGRVDQQISHLSWQLQRGASIRNQARWLYCAIQRNYEIPLKEIPAPQRPKKKYQAEFYTDEDGYSICRLTEIPDNTSPGGEVVELAEEFIDPLTTNAPAIAGKSCGTSHSHLAEKNEYAIWQ